MGNDGKPNTKIIYGRRRYIKIIYRRWGMMGTEYKTGNAVPREGFDLSVIILASLLVFAMLGCHHSLLRLLAIFHVFVKWNAHFQIYLLVNTCQSGVIT